jgi:hypothetical protein
MTRTTRSLAGCRSPPPLAGDQADVLGPNQIASRSKVVAQSVGLVHHSRLIAFDPA